MDIEIKCYEDKEYCGDDRESMRIDGKSRMDVGSLCECPEDAILGRSLTSCCEVSKFMAEAHLAGTKGEPLNIKIVQVEDKDEL